MVTKDFYQNKQHKPLKFKCLSLYICLHFATFSAVFNWTHFHRQKHLPRFLISVYMESINTDRNRQLCIFCSTDAGLTLYVFLWIQKLETLETCLSAKFPE